MANYKYKKLSTAIAEDSFTSSDSTHLIVEDGGAIKRLNANGNTLPNSTISDAGKVLTINNEGNYILGSELPEIPSDAEEKVYNLELDHGVLVWTETE